MKNIKGWHYEGDGNLGNDTEIWRSTLDYNDNYAPMKIFVSPVFSIITGKRWWHASISARTPANTKGLKRVGVSWIIKEGKTKEDVLPYAIKWMKKNTGKEK